MNPDLRFDVRLVERNLARGRVARDELKAHLASLPDAAGNAENIEASVADHGLPPAPAPKAAAPKKPGR